MRSYTVGERMIRHPYRVETTESINDALQFMNDHEIRHLPVIRDEKLVGIVSERDLKVAAALEQAPALQVGDVMKQDLFVVTRDTPISEVASEMAEGKIGSAIIVNREWQIEGIFTTTDALRILAESIEGETMDSFLTDWDDYEDASAMRM